jgi:hypothetical protein
MPTQPISIEEATRRVRILEECIAEGFAPPGSSSPGGRHGAIEEAALRINKSHKSIRIAMNAVKWRAEEKRASVEMPEFPDDDIPIEEIIAHQEKQFRKKFDHHRAKKWFPIKVRMDGPIGLSFFGDPHIDDDGCNWPLLRRDCEIHRKTPALFGVNIGDTTNNWVGRLMRLFANQNMGQSRARKLAKWLLPESGVTWLAWLIGNHDAWNEGDAILRAMGGHLVPMEDWQAQFKLVFPNGRECRIWAAHDFPGHSQWNSLHGPQKAAHTKDWAHVYACGHKHNWAAHQEESASKEFVYWLLRARGYKFFDSHSEHLGHASQQEGAAITAVINPDASNMAGLVQAFADMEAAADYLTFLRKRGGYAKAAR